MKYKFLYDNLKEKDIVEFEECGDLRFTTIEQVHCNCHPKDWGESTEDMLDYLKTEREHLNSLKNVLVKREGIEIHDEMNENCLMYLYTSDDNWEKVLNLLIESCQKDICMIKAIIYEQLENGKLFEEVDE